MCYDILGCIMNIYNLALHYCIECRDIYNAMEIINMGHIDYEHVDQYGNTLLIMACMCKIPAVALALIATGQSKPGHVNIYRHTALIWACDKLMPEVALALIATGESNPRYIYVNNTALDYARNYNLQNVVDALEHYNP